MAMATEPARPVYRRYTPEELNGAADLYRWALRLIQAGEDSPQTRKIKDEAGMRVLKMVEPLMLVYFRFLSGQSDRLTPDLRRFLSLFNNDKSLDQAVLLYRIRQALIPYFQAGITDCSESDRLIHANDSCEVYCWFREILFCGILPAYKIRFTDQNKRINFFRYFQLQFCFSLADRVKTALGWEGRRRSIHVMEEEGFEPAAPIRVSALCEAAGFTELEWSYLLRRALGNGTRHHGRAQHLIEDQIRARATGLRIDLSGLGPVEGSVAAEPPRR